MKRLLPAFFACCSVAVAASGDAAYNQSESSPCWPGPLTGRSDACCGPGATTGRSALHPRSRFPTDSLATVAHPAPMPAFLQPVARIDDPVPGATYTLRLSFHTRAAGAWAPAGHKSACEELPLDVAVPASSNL